jgi:GDP-mannose 6-dehydrogenase
MSKSVSIFGLGYVGSVTAGCLTRSGHRVIGVDLQPDKVSTINSGRSPVLEAGLNALIDEGRSTGQLSATSDVRKAVTESDVSFICVGTPSMRNGQLDVTAVARVCGEIGAAIRDKDEPHMVVVRSTVTPGTTRQVVIPELEQASGKRADADFGVCFNPEFLREGSAVADFFEPPFTVIGSRDATTLDPIRELYAWAPGQTFETTLEVAEMVKYTCNTFHALKVAFANEIGTLCRELAVDSQEVTRIYTSDTRLNISPAYLNPGFAFGGSCLPKDLRALLYRAKETDARLPLLESILPSNEEHVDRAVEMVLHAGGRKVGLLGLSFKSGTDDLRESPQVQLAKRLIGEGCEVQIWDPAVSLGRLIGSNKKFIEDYLPHIGSLLRDDLSDVVEDAEVLVVGTPDVDTRELENSARDDQVVIDLINLDKAKRPRFGGRYHGICW